MKTCNRCRKEQPVENFSKNKRERDGLCRGCKDCYRKYRNATRPERQEYNRKWRRRNIDQRRETNAAWRAANRTAHLERKKVYYYANRDAILTKKRETNVFHTKEWFELHLDWFARRYATLTPAKRKKWARTVVSRAVFLGILIKPDCCSRCTKPTLKELLDGHHHDYSRPLFVEWVCRQCHSNEHH